MRGRVYHYAVSERERNKIGYRAGGSPPFLVVLCGRSSENGALFYTTDVSHVSCRQCLNRMADSSYQLSPVPEPHGGPLLCEAV